MQMNSNEFNFELINLCLGGMSPHFLLCSWQINANEFHFVLSKVYLGGMHPHLLFIFMTDQCKWIQMNFTSLIYVV